MAIDQSFFDFSREDFLAENFFIFQSSSKEVENDKRNNTKKALMLEVKMTFCSNFLYFFYPKTRGKIEEYEGRKRCLKRRNSIIIKRKYLSTQ